MHNTGLPQAQYTVGFAFNYDRTKVLLIRKAKPKWQSGFFNGIGGKIEEGESCIEGMAREFLEETRLPVASSPMWLPGFILENAGYKLYVFRCFTDDVLLSDAVHNTQVADEPCFVLPLSDQGWYAKCIPRLRWMVPLLADRTTLDQCDQIRTF